MKNILGMEEFLNENEGGSRFNSDDLLKGTKKWEWFQEYIDSLPDLNDREKAIAGDISFQMEDDGELGGKIEWDSKWGEYAGKNDIDETDRDEYVQMSKDEECIDNLLGNIGDQVHDGEYEEEEAGDGWFSEDQYDEFLNKYVYVPGIKRPDDMEFYCRTPKEYIEYMIPRNPSFIAKYLGVDRVIATIKGFCDNGDVKNYEGLIQNLSKIDPQIKEKLAAGKISCCKH